MTSSAAHPSAPGGPGFEGFQGHNYRETFDHGGFADIFSDLFGANARPETSYAKGPDLVMGIQLSLEEAFAGVTTPISFNREVPCRVCNGTGAAMSQPCETCKGMGSVKASKGFFKMSQACPVCRGTGRKITKACPACGGRGKTLVTESVKVKIPAGADTGSRVKLRGMGGAGMGGGPSGDLLIDITVKPHSTFKRKGDDIYLELPVTFRGGGTRGKDRGAYTGWYFIHDAAAGNTGRAAVKTLRQRHAFSQDRNERQSVY